jgi:hypothetical protein
MAHPQTSVINIDLVFNEKEEEEAATGVFGALFLAFVFLVFLLF